MTPLHYYPEWAEKLKKWRDYDTILTDIQALGQRLSAQPLSSEKKLCLGIMNGVSQFMAHLLPHLEFPLDIDFVRVSSYSGGASSGELQWVYEPRTNLQGREILLLDDIYDSGQTLHFIQEYCYAQGAKSVEIVVFVERQALGVQKKFPIHIKDRAILCDREEFLLGFGFDYQEHFRNLKDIYLFDPKDGLPALP